MNAVDNLTNEFPETVITEKKKINGVSYRYIIQFINKPNVIMIDKSLILYSGLNSNLNELLNHGEYNDDKFKKLITGIVGKLVDEKTIINETCSFIKQGIDVLYKDSSILKPYNQSELLAALTSNNNQKLAEHLIKSYSIITDLLSYIRRKENDNIAKHMDITNFDKLTIDSHSDDIEEINNKKKKEGQDQKALKYTKMIHRLGLRSIDKDSPANNNTIRRTEGYDHHGLLLDKCNQLRHRYSQSVYNKYLENLNIQVKIGNLYYLKDVEMIPVNEFVFDAADYVDV